MNEKRPKYDWVLIMPFTCITLLCYWSIFWNMVIFNIPIDGWGMVVFLLGTASLYGVANYVFGVWKLRKNYVWQVLKNG